MNKKGESVYGFMALIILFASLCIIQLQFRRWEKVTKELNKECIYKISESMDNKETEILDIEKLLNDKIEELSNNMKLLNNNETELEKRTNLLLNKFEEFSSQCFIRCGE